MMKSCSLIHKDNVIDIKLDEDQHIEDLVIFDRDQEVMFAGTAQEAEALYELLDFAIGYNFKLKGGK